MNSADQQQLDAGTEPERVHRPWFISPAPPREMPTKPPVFGGKLIKAAEQMAPTRFGHNETESGETKWTWQDSCEER